jgi:hypothetical protein
LRFGAAAGTSRILVPVHKRAFLWTHLIESSNANAATRLASPSVRLGDAMRPKQTKQRIEAELNASARDQVLAKFRELFAYWDEFERRLRQEENKVWQPHWTHQDPYADRFLRIGMKPQLAAAIGARLTQLGDIVANKRLPSDILAEIEEISAAGDAALGQLNAVVAARKKP